MSFPRLAPHMGLLDKLKAALGLESTERSRPDRAGGTDVTVEYEPDAESEAAVKEPADSAPEPGAQDVEESPAAGTDAAGSTESITEEPPEGKPDEADEVESAAEPGEAAGPGPQTEDDLESGVEPAADTEAAGAEGAEPAETEPEEPEPEETEPTEPETEAAEPEDTEATEPEEPETEAAQATAEAAPDEPEAGPPGDEAVTTLDGIGPAYGERLSEAGVETVGDLREADAASLADETGLSEKRVSRWIDRAGG